MPLYSVYALRENFPRELKYRSAVCRLELARGSIDGEWVLRARKIVPSSYCEITSSRFGRYALQTILRSGFVVQEGTAAAKILDRLVQDGHAVKRHATRRDLQ
jgi:hypothetical protein